MSPRIKHKRKIIYWEIKTVCVYLEAVSISHGHWPANDPKIHERAWITLSPFIYFLFDVSVFGVINIGISVNNLRIGILKHCGLALNFENLTIFADCCLYMYIYIGTCECELFFSFLSFLFLKKTVRSADMSASYLLVQCSLITRPWPKQTAIIGTHTLSLTCNTCTCSRARARTLCTQIYSLLLFSVSESTCNTWTGAADTSPQHTE